MVAVNNFETQIEFNEKKQLLQRVNENNGNDSRKRLMPLKCN